jgi:hypothetical protein
MDRILSFCDWFLELNRHQMVVVVLVVLAVLVPALKHSQLFGQHHHSISLSGDVEPIQGTLCSPLWWCCWLHAMIWGGVRSDDDDHSCHHQTALFL